MPILLTGFEPFADYPANPSWDGLEAASRQEPELFDAFHLLRVPVTFDGARDAIEQAIERLRPSLVLSFGMHGGDDSRGRGLSSFYIEERAYNLDDAPIPDNAGDLRQGQPIRHDLAANAPQVSLFEAEPLIAALRQAGFDAQRSNDPGRFVCNHLFFHALSVAESYQGQVQAGFIHVPPGAALRPGSLSSQEFIRAYVTIARTLASTWRPELGDRP